MEDIRKAFVNHSESSIRKRLKVCAEFQRTGPDSNWWLLKEKYRLQNEDEIRAMVKPEHACEYYSMLAAEQRLQDMGYGEKSGIFAEIEEDVDVEEKDKIELEALCAPWNTTKAYIAAAQGKCLLQINGFADPTGHNLGFSYIRIPNKPTQKQIQKMEEKMLALGDSRRRDIAEEEKNSQEEKSQDDEEDENPFVTEDEADLRKLPLNKAKAICRKYGVSEEEVNKLKRWAVIDVVRQIASQLKKEGRSDELFAAKISKFSRGNRFSMAEHREQNQQEGQERFDQQNKELGNTELLSTDMGSESESSSDESDDQVDALVSSMEAALKQTAHVPGEKKSQEEREGEKLFKKMMEDQDKKKAEKLAQKEAQDKGLDHIVEKPAVMKITRTYANGRVEVEEVRKPDVIEFYDRIKKNLSKDAVHRYLTTDPEARESFKKERRRIQEQLRRIKKNKARTQIMKNIAQNPGAVNIIGPGGLLQSKVICSACGMTGHMKNNRNCPNYKSNLTEGSSIESNANTPNPDIERPKLAFADGKMKLTISGSLLNDIKANPPKKRGRPRKDPRPLFGGSLPPQPITPPIQQVPIPTMTIPVLPKPELKMKLNIPSIPVTPKLPVKPMKEEKKIEKVAKSVSEKVIKEETPIPLKKQKKSKSFVEIDYMDRPNVKKHFIGFKNVTAAFCIQK